jgi:hypothetical protein
MPPMASFSQLVRAAVRTSLSGVTEGSRRNARSALDSRAADAESSAFVLAALRPAGHDAQRRSA